MSPATAEKPKNRKADADGANLPEGFKRVGSSNLPPFFDLPKEGQSLRGILEKVRVDTVTDRVKVKGSKKVEEVEKQKYYFDIRLTQKAVGDDASRAHNVVEHQAGTRITLSGSGALKRAFMDAALQAEGKGPEAWPEDGTDPEVKWNEIMGLEVYVRREKDGKMGKKSAFPGNRVRQYTVGVAFK